MDIPTDIDTALPRLVATALGTSEAGLAQMRYRGTGPKFVKIAGGRVKVLYRWSDVRQYLEQNTLQRTDDPRGSGMRRQNAPPIKDGAPKDPIGSSGRLTTPTTYEEADSTTSPLALVAEVMHFGQRRSVRRGSDS